MPEGMFIAPVIPDDKVADMLNAETFMTQGGFRGPQETVLKPGAYRLNRYLFDVAATSRHHRDGHSRRPGRRRQIQRPAARPQLQGRARPGERGPA